jgi:hypothetical protein
MWCYPRLYLPVFPCGLLCTFGKVVSVEKMPMVEIDAYEMLACSLSWGALVCDSIGFQTGWG